MDEDGQSEQSIVERVRIWARKPTAEKLNALTYRLSRLSDLWAEHRRGLDFASRVLHDELVSDFAESLRHAKDYTASSSRTLKTLLARAHGLGFAFDCFVDIGAGKGKACLWAARTGHFSDIVGIEFSRALVDVARANLRKEPFSNVSFLHGDASDYRLPDRRNFVYLYNPFDAVVLDRFLANNAGHFTTHPSVLAYVYDVHTSTLAKAGFENVYRNAYLRVSLHTHRQVL